MIYGSINSSSSRSSNDNKNKSKQRTSNNNEVGAKLIESALKVQICALIYGVCFEVINDCDDEWQQ